MAAPFVIVDTTHSPQARLHPVPINAVHLTDSFWQPRIEINRTVTIPSQYRHCETTARIRNFQRAAGKVDAPFEGIFFNDSDVYKWLEAAATALGTHPEDAALRKMVDDTITEITDAQQPNGYLNTYFMFDKADQRWTNLRDMHELYCAGHLFQAAVAHFRATSETRLLDVARRFADDIISVFGEGQRAGACGHPEIEMALVELARATGEPKYQQMAQRFIDVRGTEPSSIAGKSGSDRRYMQDHVPFRDLSEVTGHSVRALYLDAGAADVTLETGEAALIAALDRQWANFTERRMYVTGGAGSRWEGEAFGKDYEMPNDRAYTETCAAIASVMWNYRLLLRTGEARYADLMEWTLYNAVLPGLSLDQTRYFYQNPLADRGDHRRQEWFGCACCPPNVARLLAQLPGYFYGVADDGIYVHLYADGTATIGGTTVQQTTRYPWDGEIEITARGDAKALHLRIPAWAEGATLNGQPATPDTYVRVPLTDGAATVRLSLPMPVRRLESHPRLLSNRGRVALTRGPLVYAIEQADNPGADVWDIVLPDSSTLTPEWRPDLLVGVTVLRGEAIALAAEGGPLYYLHTATPGTAHSLSLTAIPYYAWANREAGPMQVWLPNVGD